MPTADQPRDRSDARRGTAAAAAGTQEDASAARRLGGFVVDYVLSALVVFLLLPYDLVLDPGRQPDLLLGIPESSWAVLGVFAVLNVVLVSLTGSSVGHRVFGLRVWQVRRGVFPLQVIVRSLLASLVLPAIVPTGDGRRLHDYAAGTRIVRPHPDSPRP